jgi:hypothetical protein
VGGSDFASFTQNHDLAFSSPQPCKSGASNNSQDADNNQEGSYQVAEKVGEDKNQDAEKKADNAYEN